MNKWDVRCFFSYIYSKSRVVSVCWWSALLHVSLDSVLVSVKRPVIRVHSFWAVIFFMTWKTICLTVNLLLVMNVGGHERNCKYWGVSYCAVFVSLNYTAMALLALWLPKILLFFLQLLLCWPSPTEWLILWFTISRNVELRQTRTTRIRRERIKTKLSSTLQMEKYEADFVMIKWIN